MKIVALILLFVAVVRVILFVDEWRLWRRRSAFVSGADVLVSAVFVVALIGAAVFTYFSGGQQ